MKQQLSKICDEALVELSSAADLAKLEELRVRYLGKKGELVMDFYEKMRIVCLEIPYGSVKNIASK